MKCQACIEDCKDTDCYDNDQWFICTCGTCGCEMEAPEDCKCVPRCWALKSRERHNLENHAMTLHGALWKCDKGHEVEATPQDTMRSAGIPLLL